MRWRKVGESDAHEYYVSRHGDVMSVTKAHRAERVLKPFTHHGHAAVVKVGDHEVPVRRLVAQAWLDDWRDDCVVINADGDIWNNDASNLVCVPKGEYSKSVAWMSKGRAVEVRQGGGDPIVYRSVREAAKHLDCSDQTLLDYLEGRFKKSCLKKFGRRIRYADDRD